MANQGIPLILSLLLSMTCFLVVPSSSLRGPRPDGPLTDNKYLHHQQLNDDYNLQWKFNSSHIQFHVKVKTLGYIGFGISDHGGMYPGDMVIAWMSDDAVVHFHDRHSTGEVMPIVDEQQDWYLLDFQREGDENSSFTVVRKLNTCDKEGDISIESGTIRVIYAYSTNVPASDDSIPYHGSDTRGTKSITLLDPRPADDDANDPTDDGVFPYDLVMSNYSVPATDTTYTCVVLKFEGLQEKHHMVGFKPVIQEGHEKLLHHIVVNSCSRPVPEEKTNVYFDCNDEQNDDVDKSCVAVWLAWGIGGKLPSCRRTGWSVSWMFSQQWRYTGDSSSFNVCMVTAVLSVFVRSLYICRDKGNKGFEYPPNVGHSVGAPDDPVYYMLEIHYDNVDLRADVVDNSGIRVFLTKNLREHDAGVLTVGAPATPHVIIPPKAPEFLISGYCPSSCTDDAIDDGEITIFGNTLHSHLIGKRMVTRHVRNGEELPPISREDHYDFNYQETRAEETVVKKGDILMTDCYYDSTSRDTVTYGGWASREEMCLSFLLYYPKINLTGCYTRPRYSKFGQPIYEEENGVFDHVQVADWSRAENREEFAQNVLVTDVIDFCEYGTEYVVSYSLRPLEFEEYVPQDVCQLSGTPCSSFPNGVLVFLMCLVCLMVCTRNVRQ